MRHRIDSSEETNTQQVKHVGKGLSFRFFLTTTSSAAPRGRTKLRLFFPVESYATPADVLPSPPPLLKY